MTSQFPALPNFHILPMAAAGAISGADNMVICAATGTYTLPASTGLADGNFMWVKNSSGGAVTVAAAAGDTIEAGYTSLTSGQAVLVTIRKSTTNWVGLVKPQ
jgi:hypothetical protein